MKHTAHLELAHKYWKELLRKGDGVVDATCGNGHDALILAQCILQEGSGSLFCYDIQEEALQKTKERLSSKLEKDLVERVSFFQKCHSNFIDISCPIKLIVYNLGYLPLGNKEVTTQTETTLKSVESALNLVEEGGALSITCYPGHAEGKKEEEALLSLLEKIPYHKYLVSHHRWLNRNLSPTLLWIQKRCISPEAPPHR
jgi:predicted methyltransferase